MSTGIYILLDRSQSMVSQWAEAVAAVNTYVEHIEDKTAKLFISVFDTQGYDVVRNTTVGHFSPIQPTEFGPRSGTPLLDAAARIMYRAFDDGHEKTILIIMTDGEENSSQKFKLSDVKYLIAQMERKEWQVLFLGANFDNVSEQATSVGLAGSKFMNMTTQNYTSSMIGLASNTSFYAAGTARGIDISDQDKAEAVRK